MLDHLRGDFAFGVRTQLKTPAITAVVVLTLAFGIAATSASFSLINGFFIRPLPIERPDRFVRLYNTYANGFQYFTISYPDFEDMRALRSVFSDALVEEPNPFSIGIAGSSERIWGELVSDGYFPILGVKPALGRFFSAGETAAEPVVVLSHGLWQRRFGGRAAALDDTMLVNGRRFHIIGVAPPGFFGTTLGFAADLWVPILQEHQLQFSDSTANRAARGYFAMARLQPNASVEQARAALDVLARRLEREYPASNSGVRFTALPESEGRVFPMLRGTVMGASTVVLAIAVLVLLIAIANVAGVLLARASARRSEIGVRLALGATRGRIIAQLMTEAVSLSLVAGGIGLLLAWQLMRFLIAVRVTIARGAPVAVDVSLDGRVLALSFAVTVVAGIAFGLAPGLEASRYDLVGALKTGDARGGRRQSRLRAALVASQVGLSMLLLAGGGLFVRSLQHAHLIDLGFAPAGLVTTSVDLRLQGYSDAAATRFSQRLLEAVRRVPHTESATVTTRMPLDLGIATLRIGPEGYRADDGRGWPTIEYAVVEPAFFRTLRVRLLEGRVFTDADTAKAPNVVVLNDVIARRFWPDRSALGRHVVTDLGDRYEVVGVSRHTKYLSIGEEPKPYVYFPQAQNAPGSFTLVVRVSGDPAAALRRIGQAVHAIDPVVPLYDVAAMSERVALAMAPTTGGVGALGIVGVMALALTALGLYGTVAQTVGRRTYEIGVRRALGAQDRDVVWLVVRHAMTLVVVGVTCGLAAGLLASRPLQAVLYDVDPADPMVFGVAPVVLMAVCTVAALIPTWRATRIDAAAALRCE